MEAEELLAEIELCALSLAGGEGKPETVNQLFRAFHTIKGSAGMCGIESVSGFTHHVESLLDKAREGSLPANSSLADLILKARDHIKTLLATERGGPQPPQASTDLLLAAIEELAHTEALANLSSAAASPRAAPSAGHISASEKWWVISFRPNPGLLACGGNPAALFKDLRALGECEITAHTDAVPTLDVIQTDHCYLFWTIRLRTAVDQNTIRDVFIFVEDGSTLSIEAQEGEPARAETSPPEPAAQPGEVRKATPEVASGPVNTRKGLTKDSTVRVPAERLDRLLNLVGELVMNQSRLSQAAAQSGSSEFTNCVQELERLVAALRDDVLGIRMLPIGTLFGRFRRLVHDLSSELQKEADLVTEGAETELDKSILDQLGEPLVHCLRNCLDHGVEPPEARMAHGKPRRATIRLSAVHTGSDVVVHIQDDGRGIDRAAVRAKAEEKQLIGPDAALTDRDIFNLILMPGFSTAQRVTSVSGRGVGMDAIKRQIDNLRGALSLTSEEGKGTRVSITLPLTLAIIEGLLVQIGDDQFIVPMAAVSENVELFRAERARHNGRNLIAVRGELIPYIDVRRTFGIRSEAPEIEKVVIVQHEDHRVGVVVDRVLGTHQTVIQSLGRFFRNIEVVSGATIMGDGRVALILDIAAVVALADRQCQVEVASGRAALEQPIAP